MTRSTHIKSKKRGTRKQGTRKPQSGGFSYNPLDWFRPISSTTGNSTNPQSKDAELKEKLTSALKELSNILPQVEICAKKSGMETEEARGPVAEAPAAAEEAPRDATPPITGGRISRRSGRGRAPPKGGPKGGPKGKKGMMVGPRKGPIIF